MSSISRYTVVFVSLLASAALAQTPPPADAAPAASAAPAAPEPSKAVQFIQDGAAFSVHSPFDDFERTSQLAEAIGLNVVLALEYADDPAAAREQIGGIEAMRAVHGYGKKGDKGGKRRLAIGVSAAGTGSGFDIYVVGRQNPDLAGLKDSVAAYIDSQRATHPPPGSEWLGSTIYQINYTQSDRLLGTLKALGYAVVEFDGATAENVTEKAYKAVNTGDPSMLPLIIKLPDPQKTSLLDAPPVPANAPAAAAPAASGAGAPSAAVDLGGTYLHSSTAGDPMQRLLILHDKRAGEKLERLFGIIDQIDTPARQIVIDAQIIEITEGYTTQLGLTWGSMFGKAAITNADPTTGALVPLSIGYDSTTAAVEPAIFNLRLKAMESSGDANTLSNPTVLVLDGRQARIQVGKQIPLNKSFATGQVVASEAVYIPVGIVLNIKPRVNEDGRTITMQVETIVSDTRDNSGTPPTLDNRQVQSFVRVANNTPFVIGGLLSDNITNDHLGIPLLSRLPFIGALFGSQAWHRGKREVIIVITPHVVPIATEARFSYVVPKASDVFNTLDSKLFRSAYRVRASDVGDYRFVQDAPTVRQSIAQLRKRLDAVPALKQREHFASLLKGHVPGDGVLVRRMVWEIIQHAGYGDAVQANRLQVLEGRQGDLQPPMLLRNKLSDLKGGNTLALTFSTAPGDGPLSRLGASISTVSVEPDAWLKKLRELNRADSGANARTILVNDARLPTGGTPLELLRSVMVLKRVLELNPTLGTSLASFQPGLQVLFPAKDSLAEEIHTIDETTARLFFEVADPFAAFQDAFKVELEQLDQEIKQAAPAAEPQPEKT